jgi:hypothetical protein
MVQRSASGRAGPAMPLPGGVDPAQAGGRGACTRCDCRRGRGQGCLRGSRPGRGRAGGPARRHWIASRTRISPARRHANGEHHGARARTSSCERRSRGGEAPRVVSRPRSDTPKGFRGGSRVACREGEGPAARQSTGTPGGERACCTAVDCHANRPAGVRQVSRLRRREGRGPAARQSTAMRPGPRACARSVDCGVARVEGLLHGSRLPCEQARGRAPGQSTGARAGAKAPAWRASAVRTGPAARGAGSAGAPGWLRPGKGPARWPRAARRPCPGPRRPADGGDGG